LLKINKKLFDPTRIKIIIAISIFTAAGLAGLYLFFNIHDSSKISDKPIAVSVYDQSNKYEPIVLDDGIAKILNVQLNSRSYNSEDLSDRQKKELQGIFNSSESSDSAKKNDGMNLNELFKDSVINEHTLRVTQMLQTKFSDNTEDIYSHYDQVGDYLNTQLDDEAKVDEFLIFYRKYTEYEIAQVIDPHSLWLETPGNPEEAIRLNNEKQQYQREVFGQEVADTLWGNETKIHEYKMKELEILRTDIYSAQVKEQLINDLREQTFGGENGQQDTDYNYQLYLKLAIYSDEFIGMPDEERDHKIREFRNEIFPPDKLKFLEFLEGVVETDPEEINTLDQEAL